MNKRVALINPGTQRRFDAHEPLNIGLIAASLESHGVEVKIIDEVAGDNVEREIALFKPDTVGLTATTPFADTAYKHASLCRKQNIQTVLGGVHASIMTEEALQYADIVVKGEGEQAMLDIVLQGAAERVISRPYIKNLDSIPRPAYHLMNMDFYLSARDRTPYNTALIFVPEGHKIASMITSRGCPYSCIFCHNSWKGMPFRFNSPERVIEDMRYLINTYKAQALTFFDDDFFALKTRTKTICKMIKENKIDIIWGCNARVDTVDLDSLKAAKDTGCRQVAFGLESGSQKILDIINKHTTVEQNRKAVAICKEAGLLCVAFFILGNPDETKEDLELTRRFIMENPIDCIGLCIATPFPGTKLWQWCHDHNFIPSDFSWSDFSPDDSGLQVSQYRTPDEIKHFRSNLFLRFAFKKEFVGQLVKMSLRHPLKAMQKGIRVFRHL